MCYTVCHPELVEGSRYFRTDVSLTFNMTKWYHFFIGHLLIFYNAL